MMSRGGRFSRSPSVVFFPEPGGVLIAPPGLDSDLNVPPKAHAIGFRSFGPPGLRPPSRFTLRHLRLRDEEQSAQGEHFRHGPTHHVVDVG